MIQLKSDWRFYVDNIGKGPMRVNDRPVAKGRRFRLPLSSCLIEVGVWQVMCLTCDDELTSDVVWRTCYVSLWTFLWYSWEVVLRSFSKRIGGY